MGLQRDDGIVGGKFLRFWVVGLTEYLASSGIGVLISTFFSDI